MKRTAKLSPVQQAYEKAKVPRKELVRLNARCMEVTEDKCGILWERWVLPNCRNVYLWATPFGWDLSRSTTELNSYTEAVKALNEWAQETGD